MARKRAASPFNLSFLDIMFCGFGAVVLLIMLLNREMLEERDLKQSGARDALRRATLLHQYAREDVESAAAQVAAVEDQLEAATKLDDALRTRLDAAKGRTREQRLAAERSLRRLTAAVDDKDATEQEQTAAQRSAAPDSREASKLIGFTGDGRRQYLTGLKLGGDRTLILVDASSSMLDETLVNIVRRKLGSAAARRAAPKWRRATRTVQWLLANMQPGKRFQVYAFDTQSRSVLPDSGGRWLSTGDARALAGAVAAVRSIAPANGTSLLNAFEAARTMQPRPDSIILLTDGLPTQGRTRPTGHTVSADRRAVLFDEAVARLGKQIPVNTLLFPIEGDPAAAEAFWRLAIATNGSFITPSRDWP